MDGITALLADKTGKRDTLSPQLKDKYIQRLRTLRRRLQALKQLRTWPALGEASAESSGSGGRETHKETAPIEGTRRPDRSQDFRTTTTDSGTVHEPSADSLAGVVASGTIHESSEHLLGGVAATSGVRHAEALGADSLGSDVPPVGVISGAGSRIPGGSDVGREGEVAGGEHASSVDRKTSELGVQHVQTGEGGARDADNQHGEVRQKSDVLARPSLSGVVIPSSGERGGKELEVKQRTGEPEENVGVSRRESSARVLGSGRDSVPEGETSSKGLGDQTRLSEGGEEGNGAGPTGARAGDRINMQHPQDEKQQVLMLQW